MRTLATLSAVLVVAAVLASTAFAGDARLMNVDRSASPGGTVNAAVELTNDAARATRFKVKCRLLGEKKNGKKVKEKITLGPGETRVVELALGVPDAGKGTLQLEAKIRWSGGKRDLSEWVFCVPDDESPPGKGDRPDVQEVLTLTGTVSVERADLPPRRGEGKDDFSVPDWPFGELKLRTDEGDTWWLVGDEAAWLLRLMVEAKVDEAPGRIEGYPLGDSPVFPAGPAKAKRAPRADALLWVTDFEVRGIDDPRDRIVWHRFVLDGMLSKLTEAKEIAIRTEREWKQLLTDAGIRLPTAPWRDKPPVFDDRPTPAGIGVDIAPPRPPDVGPPWRVDFEKETVLAVFAGPKRSTGHRVWVLRVTKQDDGGLLVSYAVTEPTEHEVVIEVPTSPFAIVAIPRTDARIRFELVDMPKPEPPPGPRFDVR